MWGQERGAVNENGMDAVSVELLAVVGDRLRVTKNIIFSDFLKKIFYTLSTEP